MLPQQIQRGSLDTFKIQFDDKDETNLVQYANLTARDKMLLQIEAALDRIDADIGDALAKLSAAYQC